MSYRLRGRTFDEFAVGEEIASGARTVTEADVLNFAHLSGDFQPEHLNVVQKITILQEFIQKKCSDAAAATITTPKKSGSQCVVEIIQHSEYGVDTFLIRQMTGFREHKVAKILYKLFNNGEIRIESGGLYVAVAGR